LNILGDKYFPENISRLSIKHLEILQMGSRGKAQQRSEISPVELFQDKTED
jgi:hypothetical protein